MNAKHRQEIEYTLSAVVNAIAAGKLPPDDAYAWARIAAFEATALQQAETQVRRIPVSTGEIIAVVS
jgi:hypothetical protein